MARISRSGRGSADRTEGAVSGWRPVFGRWNAVAAMDIDAEVRELGASGSGALPCYEPHAVAVVQHDIATTALPAPDPTSYWT